MIITSSVKIKMDTVLLFSIAIAFCGLISIASTEQGVEVDGSVSIIQTAYSASVDKDVNKEFDFNISEIETARAEECDCYNGRCLRACDLENKTAPCVNQTLVCVCNPGFAKNNKNKCEDCNCGEHFNCTFVQGQFGNYKRCDCPKGYFEHNEYCKAECSDEKPCLNGGTCYKNRCMCPRGTTGSLCGDLQDCSQCVDLLEAECLYDETRQTSYCSCLNGSLDFDYSENVCKPCPCENGYCSYEISERVKKLKCVCKSGYKEFNGYCKSCECDYRTGDNCEFDSKGEVICGKCPDGYYERKGQCWLCACTMYSDLDTTCEMDGHMKRCFCGEGFQDINGHCDDIDECETNNTCPNSTECFNTRGSFECRCPPGYIGPTGNFVQEGEVCEDIDECKKFPTLCSFFDHMRCVNLPGSFKCECCQGYEPNTYYAEPYKTKCVKTKKHWVPAVIVLMLILGLVIASALGYIYMKKRAFRSH